MASKRRSTSLKLGFKIQIPCKVKKGFFPDEALIRIQDDEIERPIVGYVNRKLITEKNGRKFVSAVVMRSPKRAHVRIFFQGEIVSGSNPVTLPLGWLSKHA